MCGLTARRVPVGAYQRDLGKRFPTYEETVARKLRVANDEKLGRFGSTFRFFNQPSFDVVCDRNLSLVKYRVDIIVGNVP